MKKLKSKNVSLELNIDPFEMPDETPVFSSETREKWFEIFNKDQQTEYNKLEEFIKSDKTYYMLEGYAGTGKTFLITRVIDSLGSNYKMVLTAPTNKAVKVLRDFRPAGMDDITCTTIHKLLALRVVNVYPPKGSGGKPSKKLVRNKFVMATVQNYNLIIIDEASMLDDSLFRLIHETLLEHKEKKIKVIFMGDPAQIPPVGQFDSIPLSTKGREAYQINHGQLFQIMRQAEGSRIAETGFYIRNNRFSPATDVILDRSSGGDLAFYNSNNANERTEFVHNFLELFKSYKFSTDPNHCKVIAYKNVSVDKTNALVRNTIFPAKDIKKIMVGEKLIVNQPIIEGTTVIFNISDEFTVKEISTGRVYYNVPNKKDAVLDQGSLDLVYEDAEDHSKHDYILEYYRCLVEFEEVTEVTEEKVLAKRWVSIIHENSEQALKEILSKLKRKEIWKGKKGYYAMQDLFANVKYNYAITAHKSQGSTYDHVFILEDDIDTNHNAVERNRIKYTACTRAKTMLHILSKRNTASKNKPVIQEKMF